MSERPWVLEQEWLDLLFLHWEIDYSFLRKQIPEGLEIDTYDGRAWIAVVPFCMEKVGPRGCPKPSAVSDFPEINIRTYVKRSGKPGVWFFSLDIPNRLPVWLARTFFHLPYFRAEMMVEASQDEIVYRSTVGERRFDATYSGLESVEIEPDSFEHWATERYCFYAQSQKRQLFRAEVQHPKWPLQRARYQIRENSMLEAYPVGKQHPSALFSKRIPVVAWWPLPLEVGG